MPNHQLIGWHWGGRGRGATTVCLVSPVVASCRIRRRGSGERNHPGEVLHGLYISVQRKIMAEWLSLRQESCFIPRVEMFLLDTSALLVFVVRLSGIPSGIRQHGHMPPSDARAAALLPEMAQFSRHFVCILRDTFPILCPIPDVESTQVIGIKIHPAL